MDAHYDDETMTKIYPKAKTPPEENKIDMKRLRGEKDGAQAGQD